MYLSNGVSEQEDKTFFFSKTLTFELQNAKSFMTFLCREEIKIRETMEFFLYL